MRSLKSYMKRLKNPATIIGIASYLLVILTQLGINVDDNRIMTVVRCVCGILILLGILNNPETKGMDTPIKLFEKKRHKRNG